eukprot:jgi/Mesen1/4251/ME000022S03536
MAASMQYSYPLMKQEKIVEVLAELEIPFSIQDISKPSLETIKPVFESFVQLLLGVTREELRQPNFAAMDVLEFPELHEDSVGALAFVRAVSKLMLAAGVHDFTVQRDIYKPDMQRTVRNLSAIINFAKFREEQIALTSEIQRIEMERVEQEPAVQGLETETDDLASQIAALNKEQAILQGENHKLKQVVTDITEKVQSDKQALHASKEEGARLRGEIVESPEKLQRTLEELNGAVERERCSVSETERRSRDLQSKLDCTAKAYREVQKCLDLMEEAETELKKQKGISKAVKTTKGKISASEEELILLESAEQHLSRQAHHATEKLQKLEQLRETKKREIMAALQEAKAQHAATEVEHSAILQKAREKQSQVIDYHKLLAMEMEAPPPVFV